MDFDSRWTDDPRDRDDRDRELSRGSRGALINPREREPLDARDIFTRDLDLPRGPDRERVWFREHSVLLRGSESRALATTGAFRVVHADDLRDSRGHSFDPRSGELRHLREQKLVRTIPIRDGRALVVLTERGRDVLERNRHDREQTFYAGLQRPRELLHDAKVYQAYEREAERLRQDGAVIHRVMLDTELKRAYQQFLQEHTLPVVESTTRLGDWYGNILQIGRRQHLLFISERSRLPVAIPIRDARDLTTIFPDAVCESLAAVGVPAANIADERARMSEVAFGRTRNRSLLGTMNDFAFMAQIGSARRPEPETPEELMRFLAQAPILPLKGARPIDLTLAAFRGE